MSSLIQSLDMSLDDLIAKKKTTTQNRGERKGAGYRGDRRGNADRRSNGARGYRKDGGDSGPVRRKNSIRVARTNSVPYSRNSRIRESDDMEIDAQQTSKVSSRVSGRSLGQRRPSILSRLGDKKHSSESGTQLIVSNLKYDILEDDVTELFETIGKVVKVEISYDHIGRSTGEAAVWLARRTDADKAVRQYNGRTLDGQPMKIAYAERIHTSAPSSSSGTTRGGLFGAALKNISDSEEPVFQVHLGRRGGRGGRGRGRGGRSDSNSQRFATKSAGELDEEMDSYMKQ